MAQTFHFKTTVTIKAVTIKIIRLTKKRRLSMYFTLNHKQKKQTNGRKVKDNSRTNFISHMTDKHQTFSGGKHGKQFTH